MKHKLTPTKKTLVVTAEIYAKAQAGLRLIKEAIEETIEANPEGVKNSELARSLGLNSDNRGNQKDYLTYSVLGILLKEDKIFKDDNSTYYSTKIRQ